MWKMNITFATYTILKHCSMYVLILKRPITCSFIFQSQTDAILGWVEKKNGRPFLMDTWITGYTQPLLDSSQDIYNMSGKLADGVTTLSFTRKRITNDDKVSFLKKKPPESILIQKYFRIYRLQMTNACT